MDSNKRVVLVIDDEQDFVFFTQRNLERNGYQVIPAFDGESGLGDALTFRPDLILLDIMMPGIDGFEVLKRLKGQPITAAIPVIMLTGKDDELSKERAAQLKDSDYLVKPIQIEELNQRIKKVFEQG